MTGDPPTTTPEPASPELIAAYHRLYEVVWLETATVDAGVTGYNLLSYDDTNAIDEAAAAVEELLAAAATGRDAAGGTWLDDLADASRAAYEAKLGRTGGGQGAPGSP